MLLGFVETRTRHNNFLLNINFSNFSTRCSAAFFMQHVLQLLLNKFLALWTTKARCSDHKRPQFLLFSQSFIRYSIFLTLRLFTDNYGTQQTSWHQRTAMQTDGSTAQQKSESLMAARGQLMKNS